MKQPPGAGLPLRAPMHQQPPISFPIPRSILLIICAVMGSMLVAQSTESSLAQADSLLKIEKPQRAVDLLNKAITSSPDARLYVARARAYDMLNSNDRFLLDVEQALRLDSTSAEAHYLRGLYAQRAQDDEKAVLHAGKAIEYSKDEQLSAKARLIRGLGNAEKKNTAQAIEDLEIGLAAGIQDTEAMRTLARMYDAAEKHEEALAILEKLTVLEPGDVGHWSNRSYELIQLERYDEALAMIGEALKIDKDEPVALSNRAYIHYRMGRDKEAMEDVQRSLEYYPSNAHALRTRALLRLRKGDHEKACADLTLANVLAKIPEVDRLLKEHCANHPPR